MKFCTILVINLLLILLISSLFCRAELTEFKGQVEQPGLMEQALLSQAIENDPLVKELDKKLNKCGYIRDVGNLGASSLKASIRVLNLSHYGLDMSARFVTNGINLGSDLLNVITVSYKLQESKKIKMQLENRINLIRADLMKVVSRLVNSKDDLEAKNRLISLVGEKSTNDYLSWLELNYSKEVKN